MLTITPDIETTIPVTTTTDRDTGTVTTIRKGTSSTVCPSGILDVKLAAIGAVGKARSAHPASTNSRGTSVMSCAPKAHMRGLSFFRRGAPKLAPKLILRRVEPRPVFVRQVLARAVHIKDQHRHGRAEGISLAARACFCRALEGCGDPLGVFERENALLEVERVRVRGNVLRPTFGFPFRHHRSKGRNRRFGTASAHSS